MEDRAALAETGFTRLAERKGDITAEVLAHYYRRFPDARASFERHGLGLTAGLEGRMVGSTAFLLLQWIEDPALARIEQATTIVHHQDTLEVGPQWYLGMIDAVLAVLFETLPPDAGDERALWLEARAGIAGFIDSLRPEFWRRDDSGPLPPPPFG